MNNLKSKINELAEYLWCNLVYAYTTGNLKSFVIITAEVAVGMIIMGAMIAIIGR